MKRKMDDRGTKVIFEDNQLVQVVGERVKTSTNYTIDVLSIATRGFHQLSNKEAT
jgi:hypothetical protein